MPTTRLFSGGEADRYLESIFLQAAAEIKGESNEYILNTNEEEYVGYLVEKYKVGNLAFKSDEATITTSEKGFRATEFPRSGFMFQDMNQVVGKQVITYHVPFSGEAVLLSLKPNPSLMWSTEVQVNQQQGMVSFDVVNWYDNAETIKANANQTMGNVGTQVGYLNAQIDKFNGSLPQRIRETLNSRKSGIHKHSELLENLGVPVRKSENVPTTFSVPTVVKKVIVKPEVAASKPSKPEPTLEESTYKQILQVIFETGVEMERHPSVYSDKDEETLRDHFLMVLSPHFDSVSGETFNKTGKTDILIRHEKKNVFVAECKFWTGIKGYFDAIDQAFSYLTWRDSKAALILFVDNKELAPVLEQIENKTSGHPLFLKSNGKVEDGWFDFDFHFEGDDGRRLRLNVICLHFPKTK